MRLADVAGAVARARERAGETGFADFRIEIDAVVRDAVRVGQKPVRIEAREAGEVRRDAGREARAGARHAIEVRRLDLAALEPVAVAALLVRGDETTFSFLRRYPAAFTMAGQRSYSARMNERRRPAIRSAPPRARPWSGARPRRVAQRLGELGEQAVDDRAGGAGGRRRPSHCTVS